MCPFVRLRLPLLLALALVAACPKPAPTPDAGEADAGHEVVDAGSGARDAGPRDAGIGAVPVEAWCATKAKFDCERQVRCLKLSATAVPGCIARALTTCDQGALTRAAHAGRLQYLQAEAIACLEGTRSGSCTDDGPHCATTFTGLVPPDGGCVLAEECDATGFCFLGDSCPGRCSAWRALGEDCDGYRRRCDPATGACLTGDAGTLVCQPFAGLDAGCTSYAACGPDALCLDGACVRRTAALGETCGVKWGYPVCAAESFCHQDLSASPAPPGTCERRAGLGGACTGNPDCLPTLRCTTVVTTGTCVGKSAVGQPCAAWDDCEDGLFCSAQTGTCRPLPADGGDCSSEGSSFRCALGYYCDFALSGPGDTCLPQRPAGGPCVFADMCSGGECRYGVLSDGGYGGSCDLSCQDRVDGGF